MLAFETSPGMTVMVLNTQPPPSVRKAVDQKLAEGKCLLCNEQAGKGMRGLCKLHYSRWQSVRRGMSKKDKAEYDAKCERTGKILPSRQGQRLDNPNEFRELAGK